MENHDKQPKSLNGQAQDKKKTLKVPITKVVKQIVPFERMTFICSHIVGLDENGLIRETFEGDSYTLSIENGFLSLNKPLKFKDNG
jgi:hypothetical protein